MNQPVPPQLPRSIFGYSLEALESAARAHHTDLLSLLSAQSHRFGSLFKARYQLGEETRHAAGLYHVYQSFEGRKFSLLVGTAAFEPPDAADGRKVSLHTRISQHFHPSQKTTLPGKMARERGVTIEEIIDSELCPKMYFLQWLILFTRKEDRILNRQGEEVSYEQMERVVRHKGHYAMSLLQPRFT